MMRATAIVLLAAAVAIGGLTWVVGWWGVIVAALVVGAMWPARKRIAWLAALAAVVAWSALLLADAAGGRLGVLAASVGGVMQLPAAALVVITLLFAALMAWSATVVGSEVGRLLARRARP
jgi:hypothetical protein